jgi:thioester reductase-like protein
LSRATSRGSYAATVAIVLVTGGTGFVGGATALALLRDERVSRLVLLVRGESDAQARERVQASVRRFGAIDDMWRKVRTRR